MTDPADRVRDLVELVVDALELDADIEMSLAEDEIVATVDGEDLGLFIGRHGQTIEAVQHLAQRVALKDQGHEGPRQRIVVDAAGYRARRREALEGQATDAAEEAVRYGRPVALDAMNASERRIVHEFLRDRDEVETHSEGDEPNRHLVVEPAAPG